VHDEIKNHGLSLVIPAKAGIQCLSNATKALDPGFRRDDRLFHS